MSMTPTPTVAQAPIGGRIGTVPSQDQQAVNYLINAQLELAHFMRELGIKLAAPNVAYPGFSTYLLSTSKKIEQKATKLMLLIQTLGGSFTLVAINPQNTTIADPIAALQAVLTYEGNMVNNLKGFAIQDPALVALLAHIIRKKSIWLGLNRMMLTQMTRLNNDPAGLQRFDTELLSKDIYKKLHKKLHDHD